MIESIMFREIRRDLVVKVGQKRNASRSVKQKRLARQSSSFLSVLRSSVKAVFTIYGIALSLTIYRTQGGTQQIFKRGGSA